VSFQDQTLWLPASKDPPTHPLTNPFAWMISRVRLSHAARAKWRRKKPDQ